MPVRRGAHLLVKAVRPALLVCLIAGTALGVWGCAGDQERPVLPSLVSTSPAGTTVPLTRPGISLSGSPTPTDLPGSGDTLDNARPVSPRPRPFSTFRAAFDRFDVSLNDGDGYSNSDNLNGALAWNESYMMMSYLAMYRGTGDVDYLRRLIKHAENVIVQRDDYQGRADYRGVSGPTWVATKYSNNDEPYAWVVHSGMITYPMADFAQLVINNPDLWHHTSYLGQSFMDCATRLRDEVAKTIAAHEDQWDATVGVYRFRDTPVVDYPNEILPINQEAAIGRTLLMMYLATKEPSYLDKATGLALHLHDNLTLNRANGSYTWSYWPGINDSAEDLNHASITVDFARLCYEHGVVFSLLDTKRFASTFKNNIYVEPFQFAHRVDGSGGFTNSEPIGAWLPLSSVDGDIYHIVADVFVDKALYAATEWSSSTFFAIANLHLFQQSFDPVAVNRAPGPASEFAGVAAGDLDGDGVDEIIAVSNISPGFYLYKLDDGQIKNMASSESHGSTHQWVGIAAGDLDGDGKDEFVAADNLGGGFYIYELDEGRIRDIASNGPVEAAYQWAGVAAGDLDGDGKDEFVAADNLGGGFYMYELDEGQIKGMASNTSVEPDSQWMGLTVGDFDGDGTHELIANRDLDGDFYLFCLDNGQIEVKGREFFPRGLRNGLLAAAKVLDASQERDKLAVIRNYDVNIFILAVR